jgi:mono/diheme cytochrome c family protein
MRKGIYHLATAAALALPGLVVLYSSAGAAQSEAGQQRGNAGMNATQDRSSDSEAEALYVEECSMCHRAFGMGTTLLARRLGPERAMLEARDNLSAQFVIVAAREGIGNMPRMSRGEVSDEELQQIADYLAGGPF